MKRQLFRSSGEACRSRGNHASGAEIIRPSLKRTLNASRVTLTSCAKGAVISLAEVLMPSFNEVVPSIAYDALHSPQLARTESATVLQPDWFKPELRDIIISLHMDVHRFVVVAGVEK